MMISEENEQIAEAAHNIWRETHPNDPTWEAFGPKTVYRDLVLTFQRKTNVGLMPSELEQCVIRAIEEAKNPPKVAAKTKAKVPEPVEEPETPKPAKKK